MKRAILLLGCLVGWSALCYAGKPMKYEIVGRYKKAVGNVAVSQRGRMFISIHPFAAPTYKVVERKGATLVPYPNKKLSRGFANVIGIRITTKGHLWILGMGGKLLGWDIEKNKQVKAFQLKSVMTPRSFLQDFALDQTNHFIYIADMSRNNLLGTSTPAIIAVNLKNGKAKRWLTGHVSVHPDGSPLRIQGKAVTAKSPTGAYVPLQLGLNPITISHDDKYIYYGAVNGTSLFRMPTRKLRNFKLTQREAERAVRKVGTKAVSDGISIDAANNVYVTDVNHSAIGVTDKKGRYRILFSNPKQIAWPDGFSCGGDGYMYFTINQLHRNPALNKGVNGVKPPYLIARFKPLAKCKVGR